jgi:hypothetical protein
MDQMRKKTLTSFARKYVWWKKPDEALRYPQRVLAQVMDIGDHDDVERLSNLVGEDRLRDVIAHAEAGQFRPRSWAYWHYRLGLAEVEQVPEMPRRRFS